MFKTAIIGAGPAGIAMAKELTSAGLEAGDIIMFEKSPHTCASIRQFYPQNKEINSVYKNIQTVQEGCVGFEGIISLEKFYALVDKALAESGVKVHFDTEAQKVLPIDGGFSIESSAGAFEAQTVVLCGGVFAKPRKPDYPISAPVAGKTFYDVLKFQKENITGKEILVIGGGDTASEYMQTLAALGNKVILSYRQDNFFRMNQRNKDLLSGLQQQGKGEVMLLTNVASLEDAEGRIKVSLKENKILNVDYIVYALGGASPTAFMAACGVDYDENEVSLSEYGESSVPGIFLAGDIAHGRKGGSLMLAFNNARKAMLGLSKKYGFPAPK